VLVEGSTIAAVDASPIAEGSGTTVIDGVFSVGDRVGQPAVVGLAGELEYPARLRHGNPVGGELLHERVEIP
jgi:hypothetical protein